MKKDLLVKIVRQKIQEKLKNSDSVIRIAYSDFIDHLGLPLFSEESPELVDILAEIEEETEGLIKLVNPLGEETYKDNMLFSEHYYEVAYDPKNIKHTNPNILTLNKQEGLCRVIDGKTYCYKVAKNRYKILDNLEKDFTSTKELSRRVGITEESIMAQIAEIRKQISKNLQLDGDQVIENQKGVGYRYGKPFKVSKKY